MKKMTQNCGIRKKNLSATLVTSRKRIELVQAILDEQIYSTCYLQLGPQSVYVVERCRRALDDPVISSHFSGRNCGLILLGVNWKCRGNESILDLEYCAHLYIGLDVILWSLWLYYCIVAYHRLIDLVTRIVCLIKLYHLFHYIHAWSSRGNKSMLARSHDCSEQDPRDKHWP